MADETPTPVPAIDTRTRWQRIRPVLMPVLMALLPILGGLAVHYGIPPRVVEVLIEVIKEVPQGPPPEYAQTFGWQRDDFVIVRNLDPTATEQFDTTPAGRAALGDEDVFLWRHVRKAGKFAGNSYPNVNQQSVGCCVGCGWKHCADVVQATAIASGQRFEWKPISVEAIYAGSRVDVGGGRISGDGSIGAWAKDYVQSKGGIAAMQKYASADLTTFSPARAREWGRTGAPDEIRNASKEHPVKGCALVKSWQDVKKAISQGYPVAVCSDQGFTMERDSTGRCRPQGQWAHCMAVIGVRVAKDGRSEGGFILNSWGDNAHTGPVWPEDAPVAGFWADAAVIDRMMKQGDSFALADVAGFPQRPKPPLDWTVRHIPPALPRDFLARAQDRRERRPMNVFASLAW